MKPLPYWTEADMAAHAHWPHLVAHLHRQHQQAPAQCDRLLMVPSHPEGESAGQSLLILPAWQAGQHIGLKVVTLFPHNREKPNVQGMVLLFDERDGSPLCILEGSSLTRWKTAADSALGAQILARPDARTLLMVGAGVMAPALIEAHLSVRPSLQTVLVWNRSPAKATELVAQLRKRWGHTLTLNSVSDLPSAVAQSHIISCATGSTQPLIEGIWVQPGTHIDLVGSYTPEMREADDALMHRARVFVDSRPSTLPCTGELSHAFAIGAMVPGDVLGDLYELCSGRVTGRSNDEAITVFKSGGGAHLDLMMAQYFHTACTQAI